MIDLTWLTASEIRTLKSRAAFTDEQEQVFDLLVSGRYNDTGIQMKMNISNRRYYKLKNQIQRKIIKTAVENY